MLAQRSLCSSQQLRQRAAVSSRQSIFVAPRGQRVVRRVVAGAGKVSPPFNL